MIRKCHIGSHKHPILDLLILTLGDEQLQVSGQTGHVLADHIMWMFERVEHIPCLTPIRPKPRGRMHKVISTDREDLLKCFGRMKYSNDLRSRFLAIVDPLGDPGVGMAQPLLDGAEIGRIGNQPRR